MGIVVQKFGGTSMANKEAMQKVLEKISIRLEQKHKVVVVVSAMSGETNRLINLCKEWVPNPDTSEMDVVITSGEQVSAGLLAILIKNKGIKARTLLGFQIPILTDATFGYARILDIEADKIKKLLAFYDVLIIPGFQGVDSSGRLTTLGRGGSDTSGVAVAAAIQADLCEIYTDVDGVYTTDPNMCSKAQKLDKIDYEEMLEMASMGAKVLQIRSVELAKKYSIPIHVRSTFTDTDGTYVIDGGTDMEHLLVSGIAYDKNQALIKLTGVFDEPGISAKIFEPLASANTIIDMIVQNPSSNGRTDMTFTVPRESLEKTLTILEKIKELIGAQKIDVDANVSKVSVIGVGMRTNAGIAAMTFKTLMLENINIKMISTSEIKISCLIDDKYTELAVRALHEAFALDSI